MDVRGGGNLVDQERPGDGQWNQREGKRDDSTGVLQEQQPETEARQNEELKQQRRRQQRERRKTVV